MVKLGRNLGRGGSRYEDKLLEDETPAYEFGLLVSQRENRIYKRLMIDIKQAQSDSRLRTSELVENAIGTEIESNGMLRSALREAKRLGK